MVTQTERPLFSVAKPLLKAELDTAEEGTVRAVFATLNVVDKDGDVTLPGAFQDGAEVLISAWNHSSWGSTPNIGTGVIRSTDTEAIFEGRINLRMQLGRDHYEILKQNGPRQEWSYGFDILDSETGTFQGKQVRFLKKLAVYEVSPVIRAAGERTRTLDIKRALPPHETPRAPEDAPWDGAREVAAAPNDPEVLARMHAWRDEDGDPAAKGSYKLPHHRVDGTVVWRGVAAAMAALLGARGGVDIPEADRRGVYRHLRQHYEQFDREPPEFRGLALDDEYELALASLADARGFVDRLSSLAELRTKEGRVLSRANRDRLSRLAESLRGVLADIEALLTETEPETRSLLLARELARYEQLRTAMTEVLR